MSRDTSKNVSNYMDLGAGAINALISGASAVSIAAWVLYDTLDAGANNNRILSSLITTGSAGIILSVHDGTSAVFRAAARSTSADGLQARAATTVLSPGVWYLVGVDLDFAAGTLTPRVGGVAENGGSVTWGASSYTPGGTPSTGDGVGGGLPATTASQWDGRLGPLGVWPGGITNQDWADLAAGANFGAVKTANLASLHRLAGLSSPEPNSVPGGPSLAITGSVPAGASDPGVWAPWRAQSTLIRGGVFG